MDKRESALHDLELGDTYPYDIEKGSKKLYGNDWSFRAARGIIANLSDRRGIKHGFQDVDYEIRIELVESLAKIISVAKSDPILKGDA